MIGRRPRVHDPETNAATYVSGEFAGRARRWFEEHLLACEDCWREVWLGREGRRLAERVRELAPARLREDVRAAVQLSDGPRARQRRRFLPVAAVIAAVLVGSVGGLLVSRAGREPAEIEAALAAFRSGPPPAPSSTARPAPDLSAEGLGLEAAASESLAGLRVDRFDYRAADGRRVVLFLADEPFPEANDARSSHAGLVHGWEAEANGLSLLCRDRPVSFLLIGEDSALLDRAEAVIVEREVTVG